VANEPQFCVTMAEKGLGLAYTFEPSVADQLRDGRLKKVLEPYASAVPGFFLCYPSRAQIRARPRHDRHHLLRSPSGMLLAELRDLERQLCGRLPECALR
jgi:DNA-binding transcriptional LysR family regulator